MTQKSSLRANGKMGNWNSNTLTQSTFQNGEERRQGLVFLMLSNIRVCNSLQAQRLVCFHCHLVLQREPVGQGATAVRWDLHIKWGLVKLKEVIRPKYSLSALRRRTIQSNLPFESHKTRHNAWFQLSF